MSRPQTAWRKPSQPVLVLMVALFVIWLLLALGVNWGGGPGTREVMGWLVGKSGEVLHGQIWRLITAALIHDPQHPTHILFTLLLIYFFAPALEDRWGTKRLFAFFVGSAAFAFAVETLMTLVLPGVASEVWFGGTVFVDAAVVAWAIGARGQSVRFMFVIPMQPMVMVGLMVVWHVLLLITKNGSYEGMFAPFAAMGAGYLFGDTSPLRRLLLKLKLRRLQKEVADLERKGKAKPKRPRPSHLRVIEGGGNDGGDDGPVLH
ncbi:MAG: rhomboid family intramembrane serine protease [Myxococcales bacterium]|nr:rhomboid family intramembrane serine protease [Myxococcales bacterium]